MDHADIQKVTAIIIKNMQLTDNHRNLSMTFPKAPQLGRKIDACRMQSRTTE